jgi:trans-2,3-dihydro-3-hydroxyanthranilate isomerase
VRTVSTGLPFMIVPVKTLRAMRTLGDRFSWQAASAYLKTSDAKFAYFICTETDDANARIHARMFFYNGEDPATGSAAGCAAAYMAKYKIAGSGEQVLIEQGVEMKRVSHMYVRADVNADDQIVNVRVGGQSVILARGEFELP